MGGAGATLYFVAYLSMSLERDGEPSIQSNKELNTAREAGDGAGDEIGDKEEEWREPAHHMNDGRSQTNTTFYYTQNDDDPVHLRNRDRHQLHRDPEDRRSWKKLAAWNDGLWSPERKAQNDQSDSLRWTETFAGHLDLSPYQRARALYIVDNLTFSDYLPYSKEKVIMSILSLVADVDASGDIDEFELEDWIIYQDSFVGLMDDIGMDKGELWTLRRRVYDRTDYFSGNQ